MQNQDLTEAEIRELIEPWYYTGKFYGYPDCCIDDFVGRIITEEFSDGMTKEQDQVHQNLGFIPCHSCAVKIINGETTLEGLIKNRQCRNPFPVEEDGIDPRDCKDEDYGK